MLPAQGQGADGTKPTASSDSQECMAGPTRAIASTTFERVASPEGGSGASEPKKFPY